MVATSSENVYEGIPDTGVKVARTFLVFSDFEKQGRSGRSRRLFENEDQGQKAGFYRSWFWYKVKVIVFKEKKPNRGYLQSRAKEVTVLFPLLN